MANAATWKRRVAQWRESGLTAAKFSHGRGYSPKTLVWWSSRLRTLAAEQGGDEFPMVRVVRALAAGSSAAPPRDASEQRGGGRSGVTLESGGMRVNLETGFDRDTLSAVLAALGRQP